jgi:phage terminase large subunit
MGVNKKRKRKKFSYKNLRLSCGQGGVFSGLHKCTSKYIRFFLSEGYKNYIYINDKIENL